MRLLIGILFAISIGIWALGAVFDSLSAAIDTQHRNWPISRNVR